MQNKVNFGLNMNEEDIKRYKIAKTKFEEYKTKVYSKDEFIKYLKRVDFNTCFDNNSFFENENVGLFIEVEIYNFSIENKPLVLNDFVGVTFLAKTEEKIRLSLGSRLFYNFFDISFLYDEENLENLWDISFYKAYKEML